ncbi:hypothetical protein VXN63_08535 [Marinilactibacillus sp. XAAS-LB27]|uniref:hypothetical protein n=1 Tax=Marinilactibacillus sp. XAAS-LB27 TaxID=3114538 RepID=UPI002E19FB62|nr:hypothetical protein [Marinilactibacillus sp. XAAS-LB27]
MKKLIRFFEQNFLIIIFCVSFFLLLVLYLLQLFTSMNVFNDFVIGFESIAIIENGNLVTISTVIIGIYFSLYTYILSVDSDSFISNLKNYKEFSSLISMVNRGFVSSFSLVLLSFLNDWLYGIMNNFYLVLIGILIIIIFGSLLQISIYYWLIFKYDFKKKYNQIKQQNVSEYEEIILKSDLKNFLEKEKLKEQQDKYNENNDI